MRRATFLRLAWQGTVAAACVWATGPAAAAAAVGREAHLARILCHLPAYVTTWPAHLRPPAGVVHIGVWGEAKMAARLLEHIEAARRAGKKLTLEIHTGRTAADFTCCHFVFFCGEARERVAEAAQAWGQRPLLTVAYDETLDFLRAGGFLAFYAKTDGSLGMRYNEALARRLGVAFDRGFWNYAQKYLPETAGSGRETERAPRVSGHPDRDRRTGGERA